MGWKISETLPQFLIRFAISAAVIAATASSAMAQEAAGESASSAATGSEPATVTTTASPKGGAVAVETGFASIYASDLEGNLTASGERYDSQKLTAAHRSLPFGSRINITDPASGKSVIVVVNDRWTGAPGQIVNLSRRAADVLGMQGVGQRKVEIVVESMGDGRRRMPQTGGPSPQLLPIRVEATSNNLAGRTRSCANEADILGLQDVLQEIHVRNCLARKSKESAASNQIKTKQCKR